MSGLNHSLNLKLKKMKKLFISFLAGSLAISATQFIHAQTQNFKELPAITVTAGTTNVSARVSKAFSQLFPDASNMRWYQLDQKFLVKFIENDQENKALFGKGGSLIYHIKYGEEKHLPTDVRRIIKSTYFDQSITRVLKVNQDQRNIWVVSMEDPKDYIWVRVEDNEMEETQRLHKTK